MRGKDLRYGPPSRLLGRIPQIDLAEDVGWFPESLGMARGAGGGSVDMAVAPLGLVYWGRGGGGYRTLTIATRCLEESGHPWVRSVADALVRDESDSVPAEPVPTDEVVVHVPRSRHMLPVRRTLQRCAVERTLDVFVDKGVRRLVIVMPHPWDIYLLHGCQSRQMQTTVIIHDQVRHPGDIWPSRLSAKRRIARADRSLFLSSFVRGHFSPRSYAVAHLPEIAVPASTAQRTGLLFLGRFRRYKGLDLLRDAWKLLQSTGLALTIAGSGPMPRGPWPGRVRIENRWLEQGEIERLISSAQVLILPYKQASQSGLVPLALALGTPVVVTPVGGLAEQVGASRIGCVSKSSSPRDIAEAVLSAIRMDPYPEDLSLLRSQFAQALLGDA